MASASSDVQYWQGTYYTTNVLNHGTYVFNFTVYDNQTGGNSCYQNITSLTTGWFGQWTTEQYGILKNCSNQSKDYWLEIRIDSVDQGRKRLTLIGNWTAHELFNSYSPTWINHTLTTYNLWNNIWSSTYNSTYAALVTDNSSWNESRANTLYRNKTEEISWTNLTDYPVACPANNFMTQVGDTITCTSIQEAVVNFKADKNITVVEDLNPFTNAVSNMGTSALRWLKGWFVNLDISGNATISNLNVSGKTVLDGTDIYGAVNISGNVILNGNFSVKRPYGMYSSTQTQTCAVANTAYPMTFNITEDSWLIYKANDYNFTFSQSGDYEILLSIMAQSTSPGNRAYVWVQKNGKNVPRSSTIYDFKAANSQAVIAVPFILDINTTDVITIMYAGSSTSVQLPFTANTSFAPSTPSAIMTVTKLSEIAGTPYAGGGY